MSLTSYVNYCRFAAQFTMLAIFVASMRIFSSEPILTAQAFAVPSANLELCDLSFTAAFCRRSSLSRSLRDTSIVTATDTLNWFGVYEQQRYEKVPLLYNRGIRDLDMIF